MSGDRVRGFGVDGAVHIHVNIDGKPLTLPSPLKKGRGSSMDKRAAARRR